MSLIHISHLYHIFDGVSRLNCQIFDSLQKCVQNADESLMWAFVISLIISSTSFAGDNETPTPAPYIAPTITPTTTPTAPVAALPKWTATSTMDPTKRQDYETNQMIDQHAKLLERNGRSSITLGDSIIAGKDRAQQMVEMLKSQELQKTFKVVEAKGKQALFENPDLKNPAAVIAGAVALWVGRSFKLMHGDGYQIFTHVEARARSGDFSVESPILNGKLYYNGNDGLSVNVNRSIASINSDAEFIYTSKTQCMTGQLRYSLMPNINFTVGASQNSQNNQTDGQARIEYRLSF